MNSSALRSCLGCLNGLGDEDAVVALVGDVEQAADHRGREAGDVTSSEMKPMVPVVPRRSERAAGWGGS